LPRMATAGAAARGNSGNDTHVAPPMTYSANVERRRPRGRSRSALLASTRRT